MSLAAAGQASADNRKPEARENPPTLPVWRFRDRHGIFRSREYPQSRRRYGRFTRLKTANLTVFGGGTVPRLSCRRPNVWTLAAVKSGRAPIRFAEVERWSGAAANAQTFGIF